MKTPLPLPFRRRRLALALVAAFGLQASPAPAQTNAPRPLVHAFTGQLTGERAAVFRNLQARPTTRRARVASVDPQAFDGERLKLGLFPGHDLESERIDVGFTGTLHRSWAGRLPDGGSAAFIINGDRVSGTVVTTNGIFQIFPLGDATAVIVEQNSSAVPDCAVGRVPRPPEGKAMTAALAQARSGGGDRFARDGVPGGPTLAALGGDNGDTPTGNRIRVLVAYTADAKSRTSSIQGQTMQELIDLAILESNQGYANSGVTLRLELACLYQTTFNESTAIEVDVAKFRDDGDGVMDEVHTLRSVYDADMCSVILDGTDPDWCGWSYDFDYTSYGNMFQATVYSCATGNYSFAHEFGHTQGCRHDTDGGTTPFPYGHGYRNGNNWRTIMAVAGTSTAPRLNYWSNPNVNSPISPKVAMGTAPNGGSFASDCHTALNTSDNTVVSHEVTPLDSTAPSGRSVGSDEAADKLVTGTLTIGSFTANSGSRVQFRAGTSIVLTPGFNARSGSTFTARLAGPLADPVPSSDAPSTELSPARPLR